MRRHAVIVCGLGFGDEGKATITEAIVRQNKATLVVRFNGGSQAAHHIVRPDGTVHCFQQFGSGTFEGAATHLAAPVVVDPLALWREAYTLGVAREHHVTIDPACAIVTPYHRAMNRIREKARGASAHGSCGLGIGEVQRDRLKADYEILTASHFWRESSRVAIRILSDIQDVKLREAESSPHVDAEDRGMLNREPHDLYEQLLRGLCVGYVRETEEVMRSHREVVFEGAQGVLLDEWHGFHPHTTWSTTTFENAETILRGMGGGVFTWKRVGVTRAYATRHGYGPFPTEDPTLDLPDDHNGDGRWQGRFRVGHLDVALLKYAIDVAGEVNYLALTCLDRLQPRPTWAMATSYSTALKTGYVLRGRRPAKIPRGRSDHEHLYRQGELTESLSSVKPLYRLFTGDKREERFCQALSEALRAPIGIKSYGPTVDDKVFAAKLEETACEA